VKTTAPLRRWVVFVGFVSAALFVDFVALKRRAHTA
jgi:hypothetical protein